MRLALFRQRRRRIRFVCLTLVALLFQQIALAAYVCPDTEMPDSSQAALTDCEGMAKPDPQAAVLCDKHCHPDYSTTPDLRIAQVPPALPPSHCDFVAALLPLVTEQHYENVPRSCCDPPLRERFCSLQI